MLNLLMMEIFPRICEQYKAYFHTDSVQSIGHYLFSLKENKVHFATASAHKFYGPKGIGFAYVQQNVNA